MAQIQPITLPVLLASLWELEQKVMENPVQPVTQFSENMVLLWIRTVEKTDFIPPRLGASGPGDEAFQAGIEPRVSLRLEPIPPFSEPAGYRMERGQRLSQFQGELTEFFTRNAYRSSSDACDQMMVDLEMLSRFFSTSCFDAGQMDDHGVPGHEGKEGKTGEDRPKMQRSSGEVLVELARRDFFIWEPLLNEAIVTWEQNSLSDFERNLKTLENLLTIPDEERDVFRITMGYPLRQKGLQRQKVMVVEPALRPLRTKSMFSVRHSQLVRRLEELGGLEQETLARLVGDVRHFTEMIEKNVFMLSGPPGFWSTHRAGMPLIRGRPGAHPFLLDPTDFFKKAVLFHNGTYTTVGGGMELMYLRVRQLERYFKFRSAGGYQGLVHKMEVCLRGWQENRTAAFTEGLLELAELLRKAPLPPEH